MIGTDRSHIIFKSGIAALIVTAALVLGLSTSVFAAPKLSMGSCYDPIADNFQINAYNKGTDGHLGFKLNGVAGIVDMGFVAAGGKTTYIETREGTLLKYVKDSGSDWQRKGGTHTLSKQGHTKHGFICETVDSTAPLITPNVTGTLGKNNWYTSNVNVSWNISDDESDISSTTGCDTTTLTQDTSGITLTCTAENSVGLSRSASVTIKIDQTAPVVRATLSGEQGTNGWFVSVVDVRWEIANSGAAVTSKVNCDPTTLTQDTAGLVVSCSATNEAGLTGIGTTRVKIDTTGPYIDLVNPEDFGIYVLNQPDVVIQWAVRDASSSIADIRATQPTGTVLDTSKPGTHIFELSATDAAGNTTVLRHTYLVHYVIAPAGGERSAVKDNVESNDETALETSYLDDPIAGAGGSNGVLEYEGQYAIGETMKLSLSLTDIYGDVVTNATPKLTIGRVITNENGVETVRILMETYTFSFNEETQEYELAIDTSDFQAGMYDLMISAGDGQFIQPDEGWDFTTVRVDLVE